MDDDSSDQEGADYDKAMHALVSMTKEQSKRIEALRTSLTEEVAQVTMRKVSEELAAIALVWIDAKENTHSPLFRVINRSHQRRENVVRVISLAQSSSILFDEFASRPKTFSRLECKSALTKILVVVGNLLQPE